MDSLTLDCLVYGDDFKRIFFVEIDSRATVGALKEVIKAKNPKFNNVNDLDLDLYSIPMPDVEHLEELNRWTLSDNQFLPPRTKLSTRFPKSEEGKWLIIVNAPDFSARLLRYSVPF